MPKLAKPLTDTQVRTAKPRDGKTYTLADGGGMYLEVSAAGTKIWRMSYRQENGKQNRLTFGSYPEISLQEARAKRADARKLLADGIDPAKSKREEKQAKAIAAANTFESVARSWLEKTAASRATTTQEKVTNWLQKDVFPFIGSKTNLWTSVNLPQSVPGITRVLRLVKQSIFNRCHPVE